MRRTQVLLTMVACSLVAVWMLVLCFQAVGLSTAVVLAQDTGTASLTGTLPVTLTLTTMATSETTTSSVTTETSTPSPKPTEVTPTETPAAIITPPSTSIETPVASEIVVPTSPPPESGLELTPVSPGLLTEVLGNPLLLAGILVGFLGLVFLGLLIVLVLKPGRRRKRRTGTRPIKPLAAGPSGAFPSAARLVWVDVEGKSQTFMLVPEGVTIGRAEDNTLVIGATFPGWESVSRHHARIFQQGEDWIVADLNSHNGIYVHDRRTGRNLLRDGWKLRLGGVLFTFRAGKGA